MKDREITSQFYFVQIKLLIALNFNLPDLRRLQISAIL